MFSITLAQQNLVSPQTREEIQLSFAPLVKRTASAVVNVYAERIVNPHLQNDVDSFIEKFFGQKLPNRTEKQSTLGSGVILTSSGFVVTNDHVIEGADDIRVALVDGHEFPCKVLLRDQRIDLAVLKIEAKNQFPSLQIGNSDSIEVGDLVLAIGNPFGIGQTVTNGIISALARSRVTKNDFGFFIQTDASINPGNSGGALINMKGELIGINTVIFSRDGESKGIGFAIPANLVRVFLAAAEKGEKRFDRPYTGAKFEPIISEIAESIDLPRAWGALIVKVIKGSPFDKAGLKKGQVITAVNNIPIEHPDALIYRMTTLGLGSTVNLTVRDIDGQDRTFKVKVDRAPETMSRDTYVVKEEGPLSGIVVSNISPRLLDELNISSDLSVGVVVTDLKAGSIASRLGFSPRDIIITVNNTPVNSTKTLQKIVSSGPSTWKIEIERQGQRFLQFFR
ncbi:Do family serine endopeptidase [Liberibacter crescens]|nr:Do family serine endopeptidase [Liberibacter crescens]